VGTSAGGRVSGEGEGRQIWLMFFVFVYENRIMKLVEIVLRGEDGMRKNNGQGKSNYDML
jgi:hypothetical protein